MYNEMKWSNDQRRATANAATFPQKAEVFHREWRKFEGKSGRLPRELNSCM
jgi:hypothetical protein